MEVHDITSSYGNIVTLHYAVEIRKTFISIPKLYVILLQIVEVLVLLSLKRTVVLMVLDQLDFHFEMVEMKNAKLVL